MSKPAASAVAKLHKCPKTSEEIRVKGFAFCPFCAAAINADGDHNVVVQKPEPWPEPPKPKPEPAKAEAPPAPPVQPAAAPAVDPVAPPDAETPLTPEEHIRREARRKRVAELEAEMRAEAERNANKTGDRTKPKEPRSSILPLLIFAAIIGGGGYYAWSTMQPAAPPAVEVAEADPPPVETPPAERDMTDTGRNPNPDITSAGKTLIWRAVDNGLIREIRYNNANVRALPTQESKILAQLDRGDLIRPSGRIVDLRGDDFGEWYRVEEPTSGYVRFGNTRAPSQAATRATEPAPAPAPPVNVSPVDPGLKVTANIKLRIRTSPSRLNNDNLTDKHILQGQTFAPQGIAPDAGKDPGQQWYKVDGGFVAEWETERLTPGAPEIDAGDRASSNTTRALDALRRPRE